MSSGAVSKVNAESSIWLPNYVVYVGFYYINDLLTFYSISKEVFRSDIEA